MIRRQTITRVTGWTSFVLSLCTIILAFSQTAHLSVPSPQAETPALLEQSPFGFETTTRHFTTPAVQAQARELGATWVRINTVSWRTVQPTSERTYNWEVLAGFEEALRAVAQAGLTPIVVVHDNPEWATRTYMFDGEPYQTACGAIREDRFDDFAAFMEQLVARYKQPPYNVQYWEFGNEVDIDPRLVAKNNIFGCWGDIDDPYYGGEHYGRMLQVVTPRIKQIDPTAKVLIGGLLLNSPDTNVVNHGKPERFFEGVLRSGAASSFDIVAFHGYSWYHGPGIDSDITGNSWSALGGITLGKARFLREVMQKYGIDKPLFYNETGFLSANTTPDAAFFESQADHLVRIMTRAMSARIQAVCWYTFEGPGWRLSSLLDHNQNPRPAYTAAQQFIARTSESAPPVALASYGNGIEAYRFAQAEQVVDILWSRDTTVQTISLPRMAFIEARTRDGDLIEPVQTPAHVQIQVGASPIYLVRTLPNMIFIPQIHAVAPTEAFNDIAATLTLTGSALAATPAVALNDTRLSQVAYLSPTSLRATVPSSMPPGTYDLIVTNPNGHTAALPRAFTVVSRPPDPRVRTIRPDRGLAHIPGEINIYGLDFLDDAAVQLGTTPLTPTSRINATHLRALVPADLPPGTYDLTIRNPDGNSDTLPAAYSVFDTQARDLTGYGYEFWTDPVPPRADAPVQVGLVVHEQGHAQILGDAAVRFYLGNPDAGGKLLGASSVRPYAVDRTSGIATITWTPRAAGVYTLYAVIDPEDMIAERIETNNVLSRTLTVQTPGALPVDSHLHHFTLDTIETSLTEPTISLNVGDIEPAAGHAMVFVLFVEYEYSLSAGQWIPTQQSGWLPHTTAQSYAWTLVDRPGMRYVQAWVADQTGHVRATPYQALVNVTAPTYQATRNQSRMYRYYLTKGERLTARVDTVYGDLDLYVWAPDTEQSLWVSNQSDEAPEEISFVAHVSGVYQIEVDALTAAQYALDVSVTPDSAGPSNEIQAIDVNKVLRPQPLVPVASEPTKLTLPPVPVVFDLNRPRLYLPLLQN